LKKYFEILFFGKMKIKYFILYFENTKYFLYHPPPRTQQYTEKEQVHKKLGKTLVSKNVKEICAGIQAEPLQNDVNARTTAVEKAMSKYKHEDRPSRTSKTVLSLLSADRGNKRSGRCK
jgi:hypothetical protein